mgnify:CR=1 FL=1
MSTTAFITGATSGIGEATAKLFAKKGIRANRLIPIGSGESAIRNGCIDGVPCSESQHQENRRIDLLLVN